MTPEQPIRVHAFRAKILIGLLGAALVIGTVALAQEHRQRTLLEEVRASLAVGVSKESVEQVLRQHGLQPVVGQDGRSYAAHVWFHFRPDVTVNVALNDLGKVDAVFINNHVD